MRLTKLAVPPAKEEKRVQNPQPVNDPGKTRYRVTSSISPTYSPLAVCGQKLVAESITQVRPVRFEEFEMPENVSSTLPTPARTPSRLFTAAKRLQRGPQTQSESVIRAAEVARARRLFTTLEEKRRPLEWDRNTWKSDDSRRGVFSEMFNTCLF